MTSFYMDDAIITSTLFPNKMFNMPFLLNESYGFV